MSFPEFLDVIDEESKELSIADQKDLESVNQFETLGV